MNLSKEALENNAQGFADKELRLVGSILHDLLSINGSVHPRSLFSHVKQLVKTNEYNDFCYILTACVKTGRIENCYVGKRGIIYKGQKPNIVKKTQTNKFTADEVELVKNKVFELLNEKEPISRKEVYESLDLDLNESQFLQKFKLLIDNNLLSGVISKRGRNGGLYLIDRKPEEPKQYLNSKPKKESKIISIDDFEYKLPPSDIDIENLILHVLNGKKIHDGNVVFKGINYQCDSKLLIRSLEYFFVYLKRLAA